MLDTLLESLPAGKRLVEPFLGSGAVFLNTHYDEYYLADCNADLIALFQHVQEHGINYINYCQSFFTPENNIRSAFDELRERFNTIAEPAERGALLLYLNRHSYNGLVRYNARGLYNVPFGKYRKPYFPLEEMVLFYEKTQHHAMSFVAQNYDRTFDELRHGDVVYADPPYVPLSLTASFTAYAGNVFAENEQRHLAHLAIMANEKGIPVLLSNHDTALTRELYAAACVQKFSVQRSISCHGSARTKAPELLAAFYPAFSSPEPWSS